MKRIKKALSLFMAFLLLFSVCVISSFAEDVYPESKHPYDDNADEYYYYEYSDKAVETLFVTFSKETSFEDYSWNIKQPGKDWTVADYYEKYKSGDRLLIYDEYKEIKLNGFFHDYYLNYYMSYLFLAEYDEETDCVKGYNARNSYAGESLSGKTIVINGYKFALNLASDESVTDYGFSIDRISHEMPDNMNYIHYNIDENSYYDFFSQGETARVNPKYVDRISSKPNYVVSGWATEPDGEAVYNSYGDSITNKGKNIELYPVWERSAYSVTYVVGRDFVDSFLISEEMYVSPFMAMGSYYYTQIENLVLGWTTDPKGTEIEFAEGQKLEEKKDYVFYPVWRETTLKQDEVFSFSHTESNFPNGYMPREDHYKAMMLNAAKSFGINPHTVLPGAIMLAVNKIVTEKEWCGSCYGLATAVCLQHIGQINLLPLQQVNTVSELEPNEELISIINVYQNMCLQATLAEEWAITPGTAMYRKHVKNMYDSVSNGNLALFTYASNPGSLVDVIKNYSDAGHCVVGIGTYDVPEDKQFDGYTHAMIIYDCNFETFQSVYIKDDFSKMYYEHNYDGDGDLGIFKWTDDFSTFKSFDVMGKSKPLAIQISMVKRLAAFVKMIFEVVIEKLSFKR